jgi:hypothetical protein
MKQKKRKKKKKHFISPTEVRSHIQKNMEEARKHGCESELLNPNLYCDASKKFEERKLVVQHL